MSLIVMAVFCTETNGRYEYTRECLSSLSITVDWNKHRAVIVDNGSYPECRNYLEFTCKRHGWTLIRNEENLGTAKAVNMGIRLRESGEHCIKVDNDVVWKRPCWVDELEEAIEREQSIGVLGLKRKDLAQYPTNPNLTFRSELVMLPHESGQRWISVEVAPDIMGTCTMLNWRLLDKIGYYEQISEYAFDDTLINLRSRLAGFTNAFLGHIEIEHIDNGSNPYSQEKIEIANKAWPEYHVWHQGYVDGTRDIYYDGGFSL